ncbi:MAG: FecR domain-containing protein [Candidatus Symbiothrix sp.]|jgi:ferric-dicitrate binding protein FerR (iron transport regulator)|nr:FecR domain-containing protein [Candidatus Symbiothrix sp.]
MDDEHLIDFLQGNAGRETQEAVEQWYSGSRQNRKKLESLYYILFLSSRLRTEKEIDVEKSLSELKRKAVSGEKARKKSETKYRLPRWTQMTAAAIFIGIILAAAISLKNISAKMEQPFAVSTGFGERTRILLPDGSKVWLNSCSRIEYKSSLFSKERNVKMTGEAYFEIQPDKDAPFIINSRNMNTKVLGTKFNIHANDDDACITTTLLEGAILIALTGASRQENNIRLEPGQQLVYNCRTGETAVSECASPADYVSWINKKLYFEKTSFLEITKTLERQYNIRFVFTSESIKKEVFTCDFQTDENIYHVLSILKLTGKFDYEIKDRIVTLFQKKSNR